MNGTSENKMISKDIPAHISAINNTQLRNTTNYTEQRRGRQHYRPQRQPATRKTAIESTTELSSSATIGSLSQQKKRQRRERHRSFFVNDEPNIPSSSMNSLKNDKVPVGKPSSSKATTTFTYGRSFPSSIMQREGKDTTATATIQTTSISTYSSSQAMSSSMVNVSSSPPVSRTATMTIETELSNLSESPPSKSGSLIDTISRNTVTNNDQVQAAMNRLQQKRNVLRRQRFSLEQRLYSFCSSTTSETGEQRILTPSTDEKSSTKVVQWTYNRNVNQRDTAKRMSPSTEKDVRSLLRLHMPQTMIYTGCLNEEGRPHDENAILQFPDGQVYEGGVSEGLRHGSGKNSWPDGQTYCGEWRNGSRCGRGTHSWKDGRTVTGNWMDGHLHGRLYFSWPNGTIFDGNANMGKKEGRGIRTKSDGTVYNGNYAKDKEDGFGILIRPDGVKYRGQFRNGMREGYGIMRWQNRTYDGEWLEDKPHGQGRIVWANGSVFTGQFQEGNYNGVGIYIWPSGNKFVGRWENGVKNGHGVYTTIFGKKHDGEYKNGMRHGYGRMTWEDGSVYYGGYHFNQRHGWGIQTGSDGAVAHCGLWKNDHPYHGNKNIDINAKEDMPQAYSLLLGGNNSPSTECR